MKSRNLEKWYKLNESFFREYFKKEELNKKQLKNFVYEKLKITSKKRKEMFQEQNIPF